MASDNRISLEITAAQKAAIVSAAGALKTALQGITINLTVDEKQSLPRISDGTLAFDEKCAAYMASRADLVPSFLDTAEMAKDRKLVADLLPCLREIAPICEGLEDTIMLANSDNYVGDLAFYQNVRQAAKRGVSGADTIYNDLKTRFPGRPKKGVSESLCFGDLVMFWSGVVFLIERMRSIKKIATRTGSQIGWLLLSSSAG